MFLPGQFKVPSLIYLLVIRLHQLEMDYSITVHLMSVSGTQMIAQDTDGCFRGVLLKRVMSGFDMLHFVDLAKPAIERHEPLLDWVRTWTERDRLEPLTPEGWFGKSHGITGRSLNCHGVWIPKHCPANNLFLWSPPSSCSWCCYCYGGAFEIEAQKD